MEKLLESLLEQLVAQEPSVKVTSVKLAGQRLAQIVFDEEAPTLTCGIVGKHLVIGVGEGSVEKLIGRMDGPSPKWLGSLHERLPVDRVSTVAYVDIEKIIGLVGEMVRLEEPEVEFDRFMSQFGLDKIRTLTSVTGLDASGCVNRTLLTVDGKGTGLLAWMEAKPLSADDLQIIGEKSSVAFAMKLDPVQVFDLWLALAEATSPRDAESIRRDLEGFAGEVGVEFRDDLLKSLGETWRIFAQPGPGGLITGWTLAVDVKDRKMLLEAQEAILNLLRKEIEGGWTDAPILESSEVDGITIHTLDFMQPGVPISPSWCVTEKNLIVALNSGMLKRLLQSTGKVNEKQTSLAEVPLVKPLLASESGTLCMIYMNTKEVAQTLVPLARMGIQMLGQQGGMGGMPFSFDLENLPSAEIVIKHLQPTLFVCRRSKDGVEFESHQTLPGVNAAAVAPVGVGMLLPAVSSAREAARRVHSINNMKQIGLSLLNYHDAQKAFPAGYNADKEGKPLLSWRVHVLPFLEGDALYNQFHLDEPWDSEHNKKLIEKMPDIYRSPRSKSPKGKTTYLGASGADGIFVRPKPGGRTGTKLRQITDGTSNTILTIEVPEKSAVVWTKPADFAPTEKNLKALRGALAGVSDGSVRILGNHLDLEALQALFTKAGGEVVEGF